MWSGAQGRVVTLAALGVLASSCAQAPPPAPNRVAAAPASEEAADERDPYPCGGTDPVEDRRSPEQRLSALVRRIDAGAGHCAPFAVAEDRYGEVRVMVTRKGEVTTESAPEMTEGDRECVASAARTALEADERDEQGRRLPGDVETTVALGAAPPLLAPTQKLTAQWMTAIRSKPARPRFAAQLPAAVVLTEEGCLAMPARRFFTERLQRWLAKVATPVNDFWQPGSDPSGASPAGLFAGLVAGAPPDARAWLLGEQALMIHYTVAAEPSRQEICLLPFDDGLRNHLRKSMGENGGGSLTAILRHGPERR